MHRTSVARATAPVALLALALVFAPAANAQVRTPGTPAALRAPLAPVTAHYELPAVDVARYLAEDEARGHRPLRYGAMVPAGQDINRDGQWEVLPDGTLVGRMGIRAPGAYTIGLEFVAFDLPVGAQMYLYDQAKTEVFGAYTSENMRPDRGFVIEPFPGDHVILEVVLPPDVDGVPDVVLGDAIHDYRDVRKIFVGGSGGTSDCLIDVNCPEGDAWGLQKRATVRTFSGGGLCSAVLLNNTNSNGARYILTADHCGQSSNTVFSFNYQRSGCATGPAPTGQTVSGATLLATNGTFDSRLMQITGNIPTSYNPYYAGWTRTTSNTSFAFSMNHPNGGPKKIAVDGNGTARETNMWRVGWSAGTLDGGSSGGPLFDVNGRVKGPACCVNNFNCNQTAWYGRFDKFWTSAGLAQWLDPAGTNPTSINGFDPNAPPPGTPPQVTNVVPNLLNALYVDNWPVLTINGSNFLTTTSVRVDGVPLSNILYPKYTVLSDTQITIDWYPQQALGPIEIEVVNNHGFGAAFALVFPNNATVIDLTPSDPGFLLQVIGMDLYIAGPSTNIVNLLVSFSDLPSVLPGIVSFDIGNNFFDFYDLGWQIIDPTVGYTKLSYQNTGVPPGMRIHFQAMIYPTLAPSLPFAVTNRQSVTVFN